MERGNTKQEILEKGVSPFLCAVQQWNRMAEDLEAGNRKRSLRLSKNKNTDTPRKHEERKTKR